MKRRILRQSPPSLPAMQEAQPNAKTEFWVPLWPLPVTLDEAFVLDRDFDCVLRRIEAMAEQTDCGQVQKAVVDETAEVPDASEPQKEPKTWICCWICGSMMLTSFSGAEDAVRCRRHRTPLQGKELALERKKIEQRRLAESFLMSKYAIQVKPY